VKKLLATCLAVPRQAAARRSERLLRAQEKWAEDMDRRSITTPAPGGTSPRPAPRPPSGPCSFSSPGQGSGEAAWTYSPFSGIEAPRSRGVPSSLPFRHRARGRGQSLLPRGSRASVFFGQGDRDPGPARQATTQAAARGSTRRRGAARMTGVRPPLVSGARSSPWARGRRCFRGKACA
jgi:hypothetical protein